jgi:hypothetical protein
MAIDANVYDADRDTTMIDLKVIVPVPAAGGVQVNETLAGPRTVLVV